MSAYFDGIMAEWNAAKARQASEIALAAAARAKEQISLGLDTHGTVIPVVNSTIVQNSVTPVMTGMINPSIANTVSELDKRKNYAASYTGWDNDPTLRSYQARAMDIYVQTGRWDTPEQLQLHKDSEAARLALNPTYTGSLWGTADKTAADKIILPDSNPNLTNLQGATTGGLKSVLTGVTGANVGTALKLGGLAIGAMFIMSIFKGGHR